MKAKQTDSISLEDIERAYYIAARAVKEFGDVYLPTFERIHNELIERKKLQDLKAIAMAVVNINVGR
jgi:hypothetical protein